MKFCSDGTVRIRGDDERTTEGDEPDDYTFFIICPATAVRCKKEALYLCTCVAQCCSLAQASIRKDSSIKMSKLDNKSFKFATNIYWVTAREADDCCWTAVLPPSHQAVALTASSSSCTAREVERRWRRLERQFQRSVTRRPRSAPIGKLMNYCTRRVLYISSGSSFPALPPQTMSYHEIPTHQPRGVTHIPLHIFPWVGGGGR